MFAIKAIVFLMFATSTWALTVREVKLDCRPGWTKIGQKCYKLFIDASSWTSADSFCKSYGGHLAAPFDYWENEEIGAFVTSNISTEFWLGLYGANRIGAPPNDQRILKFTGGLDAQMWVGHWHIHQPEFQIGDCVSVFKNVNGVHKWKLGPCETKLPFLCQRPVCSGGSFHCTNGGCLHPSLQCDGDDDCGDGSDEMDCNSAMNMCRYKLFLSGPSHITYPASGGTYPSNVDCSWAIETQLGKHVQLKIVKIATEQEQDELILLDGGLTESTATELARLTGRSSTPAYFYSSNNMMLLKFRSDSGGNFAGFNIDLDSVQASNDLTTNRLIAKDALQELSFPFYNDYQFGYQDFTYIIEAETLGKIVTLQILEQDLAPDSRVIIRDGNSVLSPLLKVLRGRYSGNGFVFSTGRDILVSLQTLKGGKYKGLKVGYKQGCEVTIKSGTGYINSPGWEVDSYPNDLACTWTVSAPNRVPLTLKFEKFSLDISDKLTILTNVSAVVWEQGGSAVYPPLRIEGGAFIAKFISSPSANSKGFNISFSVDCPEPAINKQTSEMIGTVGYAYDSSFNVSCLNGSKFYQVEHAGKTSVHLFCGAYGSWNVNTSPRCEPILCPKPPTLTNGYIVNSTGNMAYNGTLTYTCYPGFTLQPTDTVYCNSDGHWSHMPSCISSDCASPPKDLPNGKVTLTGNGSYASILRYTCNPGYDLIGVTTQFCGSDGQWTGQAPMCRIQKCKSPTVANGDVNASEAEFNQTVELSCRSGYTVSPAGSAIMTCGDDQQFHPLLSCIDVNECNSNVCQQVCSNTPGSYTCRCLPGYQADGTKCNDIDECSTSYPCNQSCTNLNGSYSCACNTGYTLYTANGTEKFFIPQSEDGTLAGDTYRLNHSCVPVLCTSLPTPANAELLTQNLHYHYKAKVEFKCQLGFVMSNPMAGVLTCADTRAWTGPQINCTKAMCDVEPATNLTNPGNLSTTATMIPYGEVITISCFRPGFKPSSFTRRRRCTLIGGQYTLDGSVKDFDCGFISCGRPKNEPGSSYSSLSTFYYGNSFIFGCESMFTLEGMSTLNNNTTVTCKADGTWDFGNLSCSGVQCEDPGQPHLGQQVASDYREGQLVIFNCTRPGYQLEPPYPMSCNFSNNKPSFNASLPKCQDKEKPTIENCPSSEIFIGKGKLVSPYVSPVPSDNGGIQSLVVLPAWPPSDMTLSAMVTKATFNFTYKDYAGNQETCSVTLKVKDDTPPNIICQDAYTFEFRNQTDDLYQAFNRNVVHVFDDSTPMDQLVVTFEPANYTFRPGQMLSPSFPPSHYQLVTARVQDNFNNTAVCQFGLYYQPDVCSPYYVRTPPNANLTCSPNGDGYDCIIQCVSGYRLYSDLSKTSARVSCSKRGEEFLPKDDVKCVSLAKDLIEGGYHMIVNYTYVGNVTDSCKTGYGTIINNTLQQMNNEKRPTVLCDFFQLTGKMTLKSLEINSTLKTVSVQYMLTFDKVTNGSYRACADLVELAFEDPNKYAAVVGDLREYKPSSCAPITYQKTQINYNGYYCEDVSKKLVSVGDVGYCLVCPPGTYTSNGNCVPCPLGTYGQLSNTQVCSSCPSYTYTYRVGAVSDRECAAQCSAGAISNSTSLPPCSFCPVHTYWTNASSCEPCPNNTITRTKGAKTILECLALCPPGQFNEIDGHGTCLPCPKNFYSDKSGSRSCTECLKDEYTENMNSSSVKQCIHLNGSVTCNSTCINGDCQQILAHTMSCVCHQGWYGEYCDKSFDPCASTPCHYSGTCQSKGLNFTCLCPQGTFGYLCEGLNKTCTQNYCQNGGMCENLVNTARCHCLPGYSGDRCQSFQDLCSTQPCLNGGTCKSLGIRYTCICSPGYAGLNCNSSVDDCYSNPCANNGTCIDGEGRFTCDCSTASGYAGPQCQQRVLECNDTKCGGHSKCFEDETQNSFICACDVQTDYSVVLKNQSCSPRDLCLNNPCFNNGTCKSSGASTICSCPKGYGGSVCQHNIDECRSQPCQNGGKCTDGVNSFTCDCTGTGYQGPSCEVDIDECQTNNCSVNNTSQCRNLLNQYTCECKPGYTGTFCQIDVDECSPMPCLHDAACENLVNGYKCHCPRGWRGGNCQEEINECGSTPCSHAAPCTDLFDDYYCSCRPNTFGKNCSSSTSVCQVANPCLGGACLEPNSLCSCNASYTGERCELVVNFCSNTSNICLNGATCVPSLDGFKCVCPLGYTGDLCQININDCNPGTCAPSAQCIDMEGKTFCRCPLDTDGENCDRGWNQDFDLLFEDKRRVGMAYLRYPVALNSSNFSISVWLQFGETNGKGTFLSLFTVPQANSLRGKQLVLSLDERSVYYSHGGHNVSYTHSTRYNDGKWHYLVLNVNAGTGQINLIVDTINSQAIPIPLATLDVYLWLVLGSKYDLNQNAAVEGEGFYGKLSRVTIYSNVLRHRDDVTIVGNNNVSALFANSILRWSSELAYTVGVRRLVPSQADQSCQFGYINYPTCTQQPGKNMVKVVNGSCPRDQLKYNTERLTQIFWEPPSFTGQPAQVASIQSGSTFVWGKYHVAIEATNSDGNKALCLFDIFVQNDECSDPERPANVENMLCSPATYSKYRQCGPTCRAMYAPSIPSPVIHTCGPVGNWDPPNKFLPYRISPCGVISLPKHQLIINLSYSVPSRECQQVKDALTSELYKTQKDLNSQWDHVCSSPECSDTNVSISCISSIRQKRQTSTAQLDLSVTLTLNDVPESVSNRSNQAETIRTEDLYRNLILLDNNNPFNYSAIIADAAPVSGSALLLPQCTPPQVLIQGQCVECGPGTFYNSSIAACEFCPVGSYQNSSGQTSCQACGSQTTTVQVGSASADSCLAKCPPGQYLESSSKVCSNCSRGFYQPSTGQSFCLPCSDDKTTKYTGSEHETDCSNDCPPGQEIGASNNCTACPVGKYRGPNDPYCLLCPAGLVTLNVSSTSKADCNVADNPAGTYRDPSNKTLYHPCTIGTYQERPWQDVCIPCEKNFTTEKNGSQFAPDCRFYCPAGHQKIDGKNDCELCPQSTYRDGTKVFEKCDGCPEQKISPAPGATSVENCTLYRCNEGEQPNNSSSGCEPCPRGTYQPTSDQPKCLACPSGTSTPHTGAVTNTSCQVYCPSGSEKNGQGQCVECYIGYYKDNTIDVFSNCTRCSNQSYVTSGNASISNQNCTVLNCLEGYKSNYTSHSCVPCPKGTYQDKKYQNSCIECPLNHSTRFTNSTKFSDCETYCPSGQEKVNGTCVPCQQGLYKDNDKDLFMSCDPCPPELITPSTASTSKQNCTLGNCSAGYYINGTGCSPCPKGQYQELRWQYNCSQCPPNRDTESTAASSLSHCLLNCSAGYENKNGSDICSQCDVGHYKDAPGATTCKPCAPDLGANNITISPSPGATDKKNCSKLVCVAGYYPSEGKTCLPCGYGTYQPTRWQDQCLHCDGGYTTYTLGSVHKEDCQLNCSVGQGLYNGTCRNCSIGFYNDKQDPSVRDCKQCPPSFITETEGATSVSMCTIVNCDKLGQYRDVVSNTCVDCPVGTFQDLIRQTSCKTCPGGTTTQFTGSVSQTDCKKDCPAGQQLHEALNICQPCERGFYRPKSSWTCLPCGTDLTTPSPGATSQADCHVPTCVAGKFYSDASKSCLECPLHSYQDLAGQQDCKLCPDNTVTASTGTTSLTGCQAPCDIGSGTKCSVSSEACVNDLSVSDGYRCDCKPEYTNISNKCIHKCDTDFCGPKGVCRRSPFKCECVEGYSGPQCNIRPDAAALSDKENQTILIAVITTLGGILFIILIIVCICVMSRRRRPSHKTPYTSDLDERASIATRSMKGFEDYPTFAVNPAFSSKAPSMLNSPMMALPSQSGKTYYNPTFNGDEDNDPAVYRA